MPEKNLAPPLFQVASESSTGNSSPFFPQRGQLDRLADCARLTRGHEPPDPHQVGFSESLGHDEGQRLAHDFRFCVSEHQPRGLVPEDDSSRLVRRNDRVRRGLGDGAKLLLRLAQGSLDQLAIDQLGGKPSVFLFQRFPKTLNLFEGARIGDRDGDLGRKDLKIGPRALFEWRTG